MHAKHARARRSAERNVLPPSPPQWPLDISEFGLAQVFISLFDSWILCAPKSFVIKLSSGGGDGVGGGDYDENDNDDAGKMMRGRAGVMGMMVVVIMVAVVIMMMMAMIMVVMMR